MECPICKSSVRKNDKVCSICGHILFDPGVVIVGGVTHSEEAEIKKKQQAWLEKQKKQQEDTRRREEEKQATERKRLEEQKRQHELDRLMVEQERQHQITKLYNQISNNVNSNPYYAQSLLNQIRSIDPNDGMISTYDSLIQNIINQQSYTTPPVSYSLPSSYTNRSSFWDSVLDFLADLYIPKWLWIGVLTGIIYSIFTLFTPIDILELVFDIQASFLTKLVFYIFFSIIIWIFLSATGEI